MGIRYHSVTLITLYDYTIIIYREYSLEQCYLWSGFSEFWTTTDSAEECSQTNWWYIIFGTIFFLLLVCLCYRFYFQDRYDYDGVGYSGYSRSIIQGEPNVAPVTAYANNQYQSLPSQGYQHGQQPVYVQPQPQAPPAQVYTGTQPPSYQAPPQYASAAKPN